MAKFLARAGSLLEDFGWDTVADNLGDTSTVLSSMQKWQKCHRPDEQLAKALTASIDSDHASYMRAHFRGDTTDPEAQAIVNLVASVIEGLAPNDDRNSADVLLRSLVSPDEFLQFVRAHGGDRVRRNSVSRNWEPAYDHLLTIASGRLCQLARSSPAAITEAAAELLRTHRQLAADVDEIHEVVVGPRNRNVSEEELRLATEAAREAVRPKYIPAVNRRDEFGLRAGEEISTPLVILGEGGAGKSVLAGDLIDWSPGDCLLVPCSRIPANADLSSVSSIDVALGDAALDAREGIGLVSILDSLPGDWLLVMDTIDLLLTEDTADNLSHLLQKISLQYRMVVTSRDQEWHDLLGHDLLPEHRLGLLNSGQIIAWVDVYLANTVEKSAETLQSFRRSVISVVRFSEGRVLLGSPVRLAMACSLYASNGAIPDALSIPQLYRDYWTENVVRDRRGRRNTSEAIAQQESAISIAKRIWQGSTSIFVEYVPRHGLSADATQDLLSSGLLRANGSELVGFFHQTFAEFAVARYLAAFAADKDIETLETTLTSNSPAHWGVARYLAWAEMDSTLAVKIGRALPRSDEGLRVMLRLLSTHDTNAALIDELQSLQLADESALRKAFPALSDAVESCCPAVCEAALSLLDRGEADVTSIVQTLVPVLARLPEVVRTERLADVCRALIRIGGDVALTDLFRLLQSILLGSQAADFNVDVLIPVYPSMGPAGQRVMIARLAEAPIRQAAKLMTVAVTVACPHDAVEQLVDLAERVWADPDARVGMGWSSWQSMLEAKYPDRWDAVQVRLAGRLSEDDDVREKLFGALLDPEAVINRQRYTNTASFVGAAFPELVARTVLTQPLTPNRSVAGNLCSVISYLGPGLSQESLDGLWAHCLQLLHLDPRRILTAMVTLAAIQPRRLDEIVELIVTDHVSTEPQIPQPAVDSCWDALFSRLDAAGYGRQHASMALLVAGNRIQDRRRRVKMCGRDALHNPKSWEELRALVYDKGLEGMSRLAVNEAASQFRTLPSTAQPLVQLISSPQASCTRMVAQVLTEHLPNDWTHKDVESIVNRLAQSVRGLEDFQVPGALLGLLAKIAHQHQDQSLVGQYAVRFVLDALREGIDAASSASGASALLDHWLTTMSRIGVYRLEPEEVGNSLSALLMQVDTGKIGNNAARRMGASLVGITGNAVGSWNAISLSWRSQPIANQTAVAQALVQGQISGGREIALARAREPSCPQALAQKIHQLLGT